MTKRNDFEKKFAQTGKNIDDMVGDVREDFREERQALRNKWDMLETKRAGLADDGDDAWDDIKDDMEEGWKDIEDSYANLKKNFTTHQDHARHSH